MITENKPLYNEELDNYKLDYMYELKRTILALTKIADMEDEKAKIVKRKLVELHSIFSLKSNVVYFDEADNNYFYAIAAKDNANHAYEESKYDVYADEMITLDKYVRENRTVLSAGNIKK